MLIAYLTVLLCAPGALAQPVIQNPSFEELDDAGAPAGWGRLVWGVTGVDAASVCQIVEAPDAPGGRRVARMKPDRAMYAAWCQGLKDLQPGQWYEVSGMVRAQDLSGQGCHINVEFWRGTVSYGCVDGEHLVGTTGWTRETLRFLAPGPGVACLLSYFNIGGPGEAYLDDLTLKPIPAPEPDLAQRRVLPGPFWGMFTCYAGYLHQYGDNMREAGVHWQRQGMSALAPEQQEVAGRLGMVYEMCLDGMPAPTDPADPCYPVTNSKDYLAMVADAQAKAGPTIAAWEFFNEPNANLAWTLPAYSNLMNIAGKAIKARQPEALVATGGFALPDIGYAEACLKRDTEHVIDLVLLHPYAVDEALDTALQGMTDAAARAGRPDVAVAINETGFPTWDPPAGATNYELFFPEDEQARNLVKLHIQALAHRLSFVTYLGWNDFTEPSDQARNMGLVRVDGSPKPSFHAYRFMTSTVADRRVAEWSYAPDGTRVYRFTGDKPPWVIWNALREPGTTGEVTVDVGEAQVFPCDLYGAKLTVTPRTGKVTLKVGTEPVYLVPEG
jgi:hypothetical protein